MSDSAALPKHVADLIERLDLAPHPEGGWYRETHRSRLQIPAAALPDGYPSDRSAMTSILFLLPQGEHSSWHRVRSEELWIHQDGDDLQLSFRRKPDAASMQIVHLGLGEGAAPQAVVPPGWWQMAKVLPGDRGYALVACVVAPGFEFEDFEVAED